MDFCEYLKRKQRLRYELFKDIQIQFINTSLFAFMILDFEK